MVTRKTWTAENVALLKERWKKATRDELVSLLGRTFNSIRMKAAELELGSRGGPGHAWTLEDDLILERDWGRVAIEAIAERVGRTVPAIKLRACARKLGPAEDSEHVTMRALAKRLGYSEHAIRNAAVAAGIHLRRKRTTFHRWRGGRVGAEKRNRKGQKPHYAISREQAEKISAILHPVHGLRRGGWGTLEVPPVCIDCAKNDRPHHARGRCDRCDARHRYQTVPGVKEKEIAAIRARRAREKSQGG